MDNPTRIKLANALAARLGSKHGERLLLVGVFGSAARKDDTPWSDVDVFAVARDNGLASTAFMFQGIMVNLSVLEAGALEAELRGPGMNWPFLMGVLAVLQPLWGDKTQIERWQGMGLELDAQAFRVGVERLLPQLVFESYGRIRSSGARSNERDAPHAAIEVIYELSRALCLLNRRWVTRDYYAGVEQTFGFPLRPAGYETLIPQLWQARELETIVALSGQLMAAYWRMLATCGSIVQNYQKLEDVPL